MSFFRAAIKTNNGHFITAVNGGGLDGPNSIALHTDATRAQNWEIFKVITAADSAAAILDGVPFALQTFSGNFLTAVNGGGIGGPNDGTCPVHTDATKQQGWETFNFALDDILLTITIRTPNGQNFITAVNGGGVGGSNTVPVHTDATAVGTWENFTFANVVQELP